MEWNLMMSVTESNLWKTQDGRDEEPAPRYVPLGSAETHVVGSESRSQSVFADLLAEADLNVKDPFVVKHAEDQGLMGSVLGAVAH